MSLSETLQAKIALAEKLLKSIEAESSPCGFANSFGAEDMVIMDLIEKSASNIEVFSLDTGRLPAETYALMQKAFQKYDTPIKVYFPDSDAMENFLVKNGPNAFYDSVEMRKECCRLRKIVPLKRALSGKKSWITGLRREQSPTRTDMKDKEWDEGNNMTKYNPLIEWSEAEVWEYIKHFDVPYNELHDKHYPSIGCAPCTRAIAAGEDIRAGRWWWENPETKECGLHVKQA